jgi:Mrp family chromosome partitioning ATPase
MERLQRALDRARRERDQLHPNLALPAESSSEAKSSGITVLTHTRVVDVEPRVLRKNSVMPADASGPAGHSFKMLRTQILQRMQLKGWNTLVVVSPTADDGKTFVAINLAIAVAGDPNHTALLVDFDLRNPSVHKRFGFQPEIGVEECLRRDVPLPEVLVNPRGYNKLLLLPALAPVSGSSELLSSERTRKLTRDIKSRYADRIVLFDLPPVLGADDALAFAPQVDAALVIAGEGHTRRDDLLRCFEILRNIPVIGTVLNGSRTAPSYAY